MLPRFTILRPTSLEEACRALARPGARLLAGGTDLLGCLRDGVLTADTLVRLASADEHGLRDWGATVDGGLVIQAMTTVGDLAHLGASSFAGDAYRALVEAAAAVASPQLRNQGTIGGNLCQKPRCWYYRGDFHCLRKGGDECFAASGENQYHAILGGERCFMVHPSDLAPALIALGAVARITGPAGERSLALESLHVPPAEDPTRETRLEPGEILTAVALSAPPPGLRSSYRKVRGRGAWDFALAGVALALRFAGGTVAAARVVLSGVAPVPWRARAAEAVLTGRRLDDATVAAAAAAAVAGAEPLAHSRYKVAMVRGLVAEQLAKMR
jgi:xanthine dehydrogenase YagS FAD-binding subunit